MSEIVKPQYEPTLLGYIYLGINMAAGAGAFIGSVIWGTDFMYEWGIGIMLVAAVLLAIMSVGSDPHLTREVKPAPKPLDPEDAWKHTMELEHEFGLPHYDETLRHCPYSMCLPKTWDDVPIEEILNIAKLQVDAGLEDSNEIRALRFVEYEANKEHAAKRKAEIMAEWDAEAEAENILKSRAIQEQDAAYREELYQEALQGLRSHGWDWIPDDIQIDHIYGDAGLKRLIFSDPQGILSLEQLTATSKAADTYQRERREIADAQEVLRKKIVGSTLKLSPSQEAFESSSKQQLEHEQKLKGSVYKFGPPSESLLKAEAERMRQDEQRILNYKEQTEMMRQAIDALADYGIMTPNEARKRGYEREEA